MTTPTTHTDLTTCCTDTDTLLWAFALTLAEEERESFDLADRAHSILNPAPPLSLDHLPEYCDDNPEFVEVVWDWYQKQGV